MIRNPQRRWFEVWGAEAAQNVFLKGLLGFLLVVLALLAAAVMLLAMRRPAVIATNGKEACFLAATPPVADLLREEAHHLAEAYVATRYNWEWQGVDATFAMATRLIAPSYAKAFATLTAEQEKVIKTRHISQRFHVLGISLDPELRRAVVRGDRLLMIDGLMAASTVSFELTFEDGERSPGNPAGIQVASDKLLPEKPAG